MARKALVLSLLAGLAASLPGAARAVDRLIGSNFLVHCQPSHTAQDDPIVLPRQPGRSHHHTFFGNRSTNAFSTLETLLAARTSCGVKADTAAYWVPTLYLRGRPVKPVELAAYYQLRGRTAVQPYPAGLKIVAGNSSARRPQPLHVTSWDCGPLGGVRGQSTVPTCRSERSGQPDPRLRARTTLHLHVRFPDCWDGRRLDSADHKSHMAYSDVHRRCPRSHPVRVPRLELIVRYPIAGGRGVELSSGGQYSGHGDFINAWNQAALTRIVKACSGALPRCVAPRP